MNAEWDKATLMMGTQKMLIAKIFIKKILSSIFNRKKNYENKAHDVGIQKIRSNSAYTECAVYQY